jgi:serine O-acetyltransferase
MSWVSDFRSDLDTYERLGVPAARAMVTSRGLWALLQFRAAHHYRRYPLLLPLLLVWRLVVEMTTGIAIGSEAEIGPGLHISHAGGIVVSGEAVIGRDCFISHGVTIGVDGKRPGVPVIGDGVGIAPNAVVVGPITIGDGAMIGANCVVSHDVPPGARVQPAPTSVKVGVA